MGRGQEGGVHRPRLQRGETRRSRAGKHIVHIAGADALGRQHTFYKDTRDVLGAADDDRLALELLDALDVALGEKRIGRRLHVDAPDRNRRAFLDRTDRIDKAAADRQVDRSRCDLLRNGGRGLGKNRIDPDVHLCEEAFLDPDIDRPYGRGRGSDRSGRNGLDRLRRRGCEHEAAEERQHRRGVPQGRYCSVTLHRFGAPPLEFRMIPGRMASWY